MIQHLGTPTHAVFDLNAIPPDPFFLVLHKFVDELLLADRTPSFPPTRLFFRRNYDPFLDEFFVEALLRKGRG
jgi:hypothetical protein